MRRVKCGSEVVEAFGRAMYRRRLDRPMSMMGIASFLVSAIPAHRRYPVAGLAAEPARCLRRYGERGTGRETCRRAFASDERNLIRRWPGYGGAV